MENNLFLSGERTTYGEKWQLVEEKPFNEAEIAYVSTAEVTQNPDHLDYGPSVCMTFVSGGCQYFSISDRGLVPPVGTKVDMHKMHYLKLFRNGSGTCEKVLIMP